MGGGLLFPLSSIYKEDGDYYAFIVAFSPVLEVQLLSALEDTYPE